MTNLLNNTVDFYMFSPLDQFGDDDSSVGLLDNMLTDLIPNVWYIEELLDFTRVCKVSSVADWATATLTTSETELFDDEDAGDCGWEVNNMSTSGVKASIFSANILGIVFGTETSLTLLLSISALVMLLTLCFFSCNFARLPILSTDRQPLLSAALPILIDPLDLYYFLLVIMFVYTSYIFISLFAVHRLRSRLEFSNQKLDDDYQLLLYTAFNITTVYLAGVIEEVLDTLSQRFVEESGSRLADLVGYYSECEEGWFIVFLYVLATLIAFFIRALISFLASR